MFRIPTILLTAALLLGVAPTLPDATAGEILSSSVPAEEIRPDLARAVAYAEHEMRNAETEYRRSRHFEDADGMEFWANQYRTHKRKAIDARRRLSLIKTTRVSIHGWFRIDRDLWLREIAENPHLQGKHVHIWVDGGDTVLSERAPALYDVVGRGQAGPLPEPPVPLVHGRPPATPAPAWNPGIGMPSTPGASFAPSAPVPAAPAAAGPHPFRNYMNGTRIHDAINKGLLPGARTIARVTRTGSAGYFVFQDSRGVIWSVLAGHYHFTERFDMSEMTRGLVHVKNERMPNGTTRAHYKYGPTHTHKDRPVVIQRF